MCGSLDSDNAPVTNVSKLTWKWEEGEGTNAVGPAWIDAPDGSTRAVRDGEWLTKAEAHRIARAEGIAVFVDDGTVRVLPTSSPEDLTRIRALGKKLRELGYGAEEVAVREGTRGYLFVHGRRIVELGFVPRLLPDEAIESDGYSFTFQTAAVTLPIDAAEAIVAALPAQA